MKGRPASPLKERMACLALLLDDVPSREIAQTLNIGRNTVNNWLFNVGGRDQLKALVADGKQLIEIAVLTYNPGNRAEIETMIEQTIEAIKTQQSCCPTCNGWGLVRCESCHGSGVKENGESANGSDRIRNRDEDCGGPGDGDRIDG